MNKVRRAAKKLRKDLRGNISLISLMEYAQKIGYRVVFYNTVEGDKVLDLYDLKSAAESTTAFTVSDTYNKLIFVDDTAHIQDKLYVLLHELGHIVLSHIGTGKISIMDKKLLEAEAEAFLYEVITHNNILCIPQ